MNNEITKKEFSIDEIRLQPVTKISQGNKYIEILFNDLKEYGTSHSSRNLALEKKYLLIFQI